MTIKYKRTRDNLDSSWTSWFQTSDESSINTGTVQYTTDGVPLSIDDVTHNVSVDNNNEVVGEGVFDTLMETITRHIDVQLKLGKIGGKDYAMVYSDLAKAALSEAMSFVKEQNQISFGLLTSAREADAMQSKADGEYIKTIAEIDKVYGYDFEFGDDKYIDRESLVNASDGKLDHEVVGVMINNASVRAKTEDETGFAVDVDGVKTVSTEDTKHKTAIESEELNQLSTIAKVRDEFGYDIDKSGNINTYSGVETRHFQEVEKMVNDVTISGNEAVSSEHKKNISVKDDIVYEANMKRKIGVKFTFDENGKIDGFKNVVRYASYEYVGRNDDGDLLGSYNYNPETDEFEDVGAGNGYYNRTEPTSDLPNGISGDNFAPQSEWEANMRKSIKENEIALMSAKGYRADSYYKQYKVLQDMLFGLANAGVVTDDDTTNADSPYSLITKAIEVNMNKQSAVWENESKIDDTSDVNLYGTTPLVSISNTEAE